MMSEWQRLKEMSDQDFEFEKLDNFDRSAKKYESAMLNDPAVAYGSREMDLAMMLLFGGFSSEVFIRYDELFPLTENWKERVSLWQLYYLLVHLNLFGSGYLSRVQDILRMYT